VPLWFRRVRQALFGMSKITKFFSFSWSTLHVNHWHHTILMINTVIMYNKYMLFAGQEVRIGKNCALGLDYGPRPLNFHCSHLTFRK